MGRLRDCGCDRQESGPGGACSTALSSGDKNATGRVPKHCVIISNLGASVILQLSIYLLHPGLGPLTKEGCRALGASPEQATKV